jgi:hypothetical protein
VNAAVPSASLLSTELLRARRVKYFAHHGKVEDSRKVEALEIGCNALDMAFRLEGSYSAPKADTHEIKTVSCIVLDVPRPPRPGNAAQQASSC